MSEPNLPSLLEATYQVNNNYKNFQVGFLGDQLKDLKELAMQNLIFNKDNCSGSSFYGREWNRGLVSDVLTQKRI